MMAATMMAATMVTTAMVTAAMMTAAMMTSAVAATAMVAAQAADEMDVARKSVQLRNDKLCLVLPASLQAFSSSGRSDRLPLSTSVNSPTSFQQPPFK
jgi:hypothetical protein